MNTCNHCHKEKPWSEFYKSTRTRSGYRNTCIPCCAIAAKKRSDKIKHLNSGYKATRKMPSKERLRNLFAYNDDGSLTRLTSSGCRKAGTIERGKLEASGYRRIMVDSILYLHHRIVWQWHYGDSPRFIDHIDGDRSNSRIENLRRVSRSSNSQHQLLPKNNTSGYFGVSYYPYNGSVKWVAKICVNSKAVQLGYFSTPEHAAIAYCKKCVELHGEFGKRKVLHNINTMIERGFDPKDYGWE